MTRQKKNKPKHYLRIALFTLVLNVILLAINFGYHYQHLWREPQLQIVGGPVLTGATSTPAENRYLVNVTKIEPRFSKWKNMSFSTVEDTHRKYWESSFKISYRQTFGCYKPQCEIMVRHDCEYVPIYYVADVNGKPQVLVEVTDTCYLDNIGLSPDNVCFDHQQLETWHEPDGSVYYVCRWV